MIVSAQVVFHLAFHDWQIRIYKIIDYSYFQLRRRIQGVSTSNYTEDLSSSGKISSDYYTHEEMLQFKKPKKKKSLRKKEKLDLDALEAEALSAGLGAGDLGTRNTRETQAIREEKEKSETERRNSAYQSAYAKADEASKALRMEQTLTVQSEEDGSLVFGDEDEDLYRSLEKARKLALKKQDEAMPSGPQAIAALASTTASNQNLESQNAAVGELQENKIIFTEMEEFVSGLQLDDGITFCLISTFILILTFLEPFRYQKGKKKKKNRKVKKAKPIS